MSSDELEFWDERYRSRRMPWDFGGVPEALIEWLQKCERAGRALIPGCGSGYEVRAFAERGWSVLAVDFSPAAVERARAELGPLGDCVVLGDFFCDLLGETKFDVVYERTFLCALPPGTWPEYARRVASSLGEKGKLLGFFYYGHEDEPPPYPLTEDLAQSLFGAEFTLVVDQAATDSLPLYAGHERWQVWEKKGRLVGR